MGTHKDRLIQAAALLDMDPDDLLARLDAPNPAPPCNRADALLDAARLCAAEGLTGHALRRYRALDAHLSAGGSPPEAWREGPDAPECGHNNESLTPERLVRCNDCGKVFGTEAVANHLSTDKSK